MDSLGASDNRRHATLHITADGTIMPVGLPWSYIFPKPSELLISHGIMAPDIGKAIKLRNAHPLDFAIPLFANFVHH